MVTEARTTVALYSRGRARRSLIDTIFFRVLSQAATILGYIVLVRGMQEEDFGVLNLLYAFIPVLSTVASLGLEQTLRRYQPEYLSADNGPAAAWLVRVTASARFGSNVILLSIILLTWNHVAPFFKLDPYRGAFVIFCALVLLHFQARILQIALAGHMMHRFSVGSMAMLAISKLAGYALLDLSDQFTLDNVIIVDTVGYAVAFVLMRIVYRAKGARLDTARGGRPPPLERRRMFRYGLLNNFNDAGTLMLTSKTDNFFIAAIIDPLSVAVYAFYTRLSEMTTHLQPARLFENVVQPLVFAVPQNEASRRLPEYFTLLVNIGLAVQWPILIFVVAFHAEVVMLVFGGKYIDYSWMLPLIVGFATLNCIANPVTLVAQYRERAGVILASKLFGIYNAVALLVLIPLAGVYGAAIATGTAQLMKNSFVWWHVREDARWTNVSGSLLAGLALWGGTLLACRSAATWVPGGAATDVAVGAAIIALASLLHVRGPAFAPGDRRILGSVFQGREARLLRRLGVVQADPRAD